MPSHLNAVACLVACVVTSGVETDSVDWPRQQFQFRNSRNHL